MSGSEGRGRLGFSAPDVPAGEVYDRCVRCGLCLPVCPTYVETLVETSGPRGRIALIKAVAEGKLALDSPGFVHQMGECLDCRACEAACPSGVEYGRLLEPARTQLERAKVTKRSPLAALLRRLGLGLFANPAAMRAFARVVRFAQRSGLQALAERSGLLLAFGLERSARLAPPLSARFFVPRDQRWPAEGERKTTAFLHAGCVMAVAFAEVDEATVRVLRRCGCEVTAPAAQGCCGAIAVHAGEMELGRRLARRNIAAFERSGAEVYVVNAAGCGSALKEYGTLLAGDAAWAERARTFSARVRDLGELLDRIGLAPSLGPLARTVTYQDPCHLVHAQRIANAPRRLLRAIPGLRLVEMQESALCCGSAGIYNLTQPEMSDRLAQRKVERILETDAEMVVTANPGCALQLRAALRAAGDRRPVVQLVELLDEAFAAYSPASLPSPQSAAATLG
ncbi:MAG: (Fe-S)-binding protein [Vulcanimicrobiaceae bacterium]